MGVVQADASEATVVFSGLMVDPSLGSAAEVVMLVGPCLSGSSDIIDQLLSKRP